MNSNNNHQKNSSTPIVICLLATMLILLSFKTFNYSNIFTHISENNTIENINFKNNEKFNGEVLSVNTTKTKSDPKIYLGGYPVGIKMNTEGLLVVGFSDIEIDKTKMDSPALKAGIRIGDSILKVNGNTVNSSRDLARLINSTENDVELTIVREEKIINITVAPVKSNIDHIRKVGLWVRDSTAGVGTMTFFCPERKVYGALGHPITDVDTNTILKVRNGEIVNATIIGIKKGEKGNPGELKGVFLNDRVSMGSIKSNTSYGIYGVYEDMSRGYDSKPIEIMKKDDVNEGKAQIYTTIDEEGPKLYDVEIIKKYNQNSPETKSLVIHVTDKRLLDKTGGIVQGMSGSPILQDGKLVGAVTHVLVNRSDVGYGVYIEWMMKEAGLSE